MDIELSQLNEHSESETLELKESFDSKAVETIGAFANTDGGTMLIGVRDDGRVTGITLGDNTLEEWAQRMQSKIQPRYMPSVARHEHNGRTVVAISINRSDTPICVEGRYIKRVGRTNQIMSPTEVRERLLSSPSSTWDSKCEEGATLDDLDPKGIQKFLHLLNHSGRRTVPVDEEPLSVLRKLRLIDNGKPTRAALLLLGKEPKRFYPSAFIKAGRFKSLTTIVDDKEFDGTLFEQMEAAMGWFQSRLETRLIVGKSGMHKKASSMVQREEVWQYPLGALREAIANAVCHRNYQSGVATTIRLFDDQLEIWNPGHLPSELRPEDLFQPHDSHTPNKLIAEAFFNTGIIERWGTGTLLIAAAVEEQGLPAPKFDTSVHQTFKLILFGSETKLIERLKTLGLTERQIKAVHHLQSNGTLTNSEYQSLFEASRATASRDLSSLVSKGLITKEGITGKGTIYRLAD